jgi:hypothetical protein
MRPIINKEDDLVKRYLQVREELLKFAYNDDKLKTMIDYILEEGKIESVLYRYDKSITLNKLSKKARKLIDSYDPVLDIVENKYIAHEHRKGSFSFKTKRERTNYLKKISKDYDFDAFSSYDICEIKEIKGSLEDNYDYLIEKYEDGCELFILADSILSDNIKIAIIED